MSDRFRFNGGSEYVPAGGMRRGGPRLLGRVTTGVALVGILIWSLLALFAFVVAEPLLSWLSSALGVVVANGEAVAKVMGVEGIGSVLMNGVDANGLAQLLMNLLNLVAKPAIVVIWAIGVVILLVLPWLARKIGGRFRV